MTDDRDDIDPADWLAQQFGEDEPVKRARRAAPPPLVPPTPAPQPSTPPLPAAIPPAAQLPPVTPPPASTPAVEPGGFVWGLTPSASTPAPTPPAGATPPVTPPPLVPPTPPTPAPAATPATPPAQDWDTPTVASPITPGPAADDWDTPTVASPVQPSAADYPATVAYPAAEVARQEFPGFGTTPVDRALDGVTEVLGAQAVGLPTPEGEGPASDLDDLFGEKAFVEYGDEPIIPVPQRSNAVAVVERRPAAPAAPREPMPKVQKVLLSVAGGLVAALALVALFLLGTRIGQSAPAPVVAETPTPSAVAPITAVGPVPPGDYNWSELLGGECITPYETPWADNFTVVDCAQPHQAQMVLRGEFTDAADIVYPGVEALQSRMTALCTPPTVIDYAATAGATDILVGASFPADEADWSDGNRTFYCFVSRANAAQFTTSIAVPQVAATPAP